MDCTSVRESLSAAMDGEDAGSADPPAVKAHLRGCARCREWVADVRRIDRTARLAPVPETAPDLVAGVLAQTGLPRTGRRIRVLRLALCVTAIAQIVVGLAGLVGTVGVSMHGMSMAMPSHMSHELVAFNVAFGVVLLVVAARAERARAQVPTLVAFVAVLGVVSVIDLADGAVGWVRLATHIPIVVGLILTAWVSRMAITPAGPEGSLSALAGRAGRRPAPGMWQWAGDGPPPSPAAAEREDRRVA